MYSSELSSKASSSAPDRHRQSQSVLQHRHALLVVGVVKPRLTSELHVGYNDLLTDAGECVLVFKQMFVVWPFTDGRQELDGVAHKLQTTKTLSRQ